MKSEVIDTDADAVLKYLRNKAETYQLLTREAWKTYTDAKAVYILNKEKENEDK